MTYRVGLHPDLKDDVRSFTAPKLRYWNISLDQIAADPSARQGAFFERVIPFLPFPRRERRFEITADMSISDEPIWIFLADFFPGAIVYMLKDYERSVRLAAGLEGEALIIQIRPQRRRVLWLDG